MTYRLSGSKRHSIADFRDRGTSPTMVRLGLLEGGAVGGSFEVFMDSLFQRTRSDAMNYANLGPIGEIGLIEKLLQFAQGLTGAHSNQVELLAIAARCGDGDARFVHGGIRGPRPANPIA